MAKESMMKKAKDFLNKENKENNLQPDLGIKIGTPDEVLWTDVVKGYEDSISNMEKQLRVNKLFLEAAKKELAAAASK